MACCRVRVTEYNSAALSPLEGGHHFTISLTIVWPQAKQQGRNAALPINRKLDERFTEHGPTHQNKTQVPPQSVSPMPPSEGRQNENHNNRKLTKLITWITALSNSMKLGATLCRATQDRWIMVEGSNKMWSTGEGNGKPLHYSCLEDPMNSMKRQKEQDTERWTPQVSRCTICYRRRVEKWFQKE